MLNPKELLTKVSYQSSLYLNTILLTLCIDKGHYDLVFLTELINNSVSKNEQAGHNDLAAQSIP